MFLRIIQLRVREADEAAFTRFYEERVIPALDATPGCLYAGLLAPWRGEAHQSLTIWDSADERRAPTRRRASTIVCSAEAAPFLSERTEWRVRLATDPLETSDPSRREIPSAGYNVDAESGSETLDGERRSAFVRIVSLRVDPGSPGRFRRDLPREGHPGAARGSRLPRHLPRRKRPRPERHRSRSRSGIAKRTPCATR